MRPGGVPGSSSDRRWGPLLFPISEGDGGGGNVPGGCRSASPWANVHRAPCLHTLPLRKLLHNLDL